LLSMKRNICRKWNGSATFVLSGPEVESQALVAAIRFGSNGIKQASLAQDGRRKRGF